MGICTDDGNQFAVIGQQRRPEGRPYKTMIRYDYPTAQRRELMFIEVYYGFGPENDQAVLQGNGWVSLMKTIRIPLTEFKDTQGNPFNLSSIKSVQLVFDITPIGTVYVGDIRFSHRYK